MRSYLNGISTRIIITLVCLIAYGWANNARGQVTIAPTALFLDSQTRFGSFIVINNSEQPQEVSIEFVFGYPTTDSLGNTHMVYDDSTRAEQYSIADEIRAFPRNFTLPPQERQVVRFTLSPTPDHEDGMYWTRVKTISNPQSPPVEASADDDIAAQINFEFEQITAAFFKKGEVATGVDISDIRVQANSDTTSFILTEIERTGNSPFLGSSIVRIFDQNEKKVFENRRPVAIYFDSIQKIELDNASLTRGNNYTAEIEYVTQRSDIAEGELIQSQPVSKRIEFTFR